MCETTQQPASTSGGAGNRNDNLKTAYEHLSRSHDAIDGFRSRLLGLLPIASAGGIFLLLKNKGIPDNDVLSPIGFFGFATALGLFAYELYGIRKCHEIILAAQKVEAQLEITGPFTIRPRELFGIINEPFAAGIIYPAVMAAWMFMGLYFTGCRTRLWIAGLVFGVGFIAMLVYNLHLKHDAKNRRPSRACASEC